MQDQLRSSTERGPSARLIESLNTLNQAAVAIDERGYVCYANEEASAFFGKPHDRLLGLYLTTLLPGAELKTLLSSARPVVLPIQAYGSGSQVALAIPTGAPPGLLAICLDRSILVGSSEAGNRDWSPRYNFSDIIGVSEALAEIKRKARRVAGTDATVLIRGESGTGKELFAHAIHSESRRSTGPFVRLNCSSIPTELLEAELFGYQAGAFTGASRQGRAGMFELANGGTIFLDEISQMNWDIQAKLLRVLQEKEIIRVGGSRPILVDFRLILATNVSLETLIQAGKFRSDLYYRINVYPLAIPPLRERREDIPVLIRSFVERLQRDPKSRQKRLSREVVKAFERFDWPGNVRELQHVMEQLFISSVNPVVHQEDLPPYILHGRGGVRDPSATGLSGDLKEIMEQTEREVLVTALNESSGNKRKAAELLGIHRSGLYQKLKKHNLMK